MGGHPPPAPPPVTGLPPLACLHLYPPCGPRLSWEIPLSLHTWNFEGLGKCFTHQDEIQFLSIGGISDCALGKQQNPSHFSTSLGASVKGLPVTECAEDASVLPCDPGTLGSRAVLLFPGG